MKLARLSSVPLWTLLVFSAILGISRASPKKDWTITVDNYTTSSISLSWDDPMGNSSFYRVQWTDGNVSHNNSVNTTNITITDLTAGVQYTITVTALTNGGSNEGQKASVSQYTKPGEIKTLSVSTNTSSISLQWTSPQGGVFEYRLEWTSNEDETNMSTFDNFSVLSELIPGTSYTISVIAVAGDNKTEGQAYRLTAVTEPEVVRNITVADITTSSISLKWNKPIGSSSFYRVQWTDGNVSHNNSVNATNITITDLTAGVEYTITVTALTNGGSTEGQNASVSQYTKPEVVTNINVADITTSSISLTWNKPIGSSSFYRVQWTDGNVSHNNSVNTTNITITDLTAGVQYTITVTAVTNGGSTEGQNASVSQYTKPEVVRNITVANITTSSISLKWIEPIGKRSFYRVQWTDGNVSHNNSVNTTNITITDLTAGVEYTITVTALTNGGSTEGQNASVSQYTKPEVVRNITVADITTSSISLKWNKPIGNSSFYRVQWTDGNVSHNNSVNTTNITITDLTAGVQYTITVTAVTNGGSTEGQNASVSQYTRPYKPENITVTARGTNYLNISWTLRDGRVDHYLVTISDESLMYLYSNQTEATKVSFTDLKPGRAFSINVTSVAGLFKITSNASIFATVPTPPGGPIIIIQQTNILDLKWQTPALMEGAPNISYNITFQTEGGTVQNQSSSSNATQLNGLSSGTFHNITVETVGPQSLRSTTIHGFAFTLPNPVQNLSASPISTSSIKVKWLPPKEAKLSYKYLVQTKNATGLLFNTTVHNNSIEITNLDPGTRYDISVTTIVGERSQSTVESTFSYTTPNPPGPITVVSQTVNSINFTWPLPQGMDPNQYNFSVSSLNKSSLTRNNWYVLQPLESGSPYNFSVVTVGVYLSTPVTTTNYTRPYNVTTLRQTEITTKSVTLEWEQLESKSDYSYLVKSSAFNQSKTVPNDTYTVTELLSGSDYSFTVITQTADGTQAAPVTVFCFTRPFSTSGFQFEAVNTTAVRLAWDKPQEYKAEYTYRVETTGCGSQNKNTTVNVVDFSGLTPGSNCTFCVFVKAANGIEGEASCTSQYTKPEAVQPWLSSKGLNSSMLVWWRTPPGRVEHYKVELNSTSMNLEKDTLNSTQTEYQFNNLSAGRLYSAVVTTFSGPFNASSDFITNATFPNPPGTINVSMKTTSSFDIMWTEAPLMTGATFYYQLINQSAQKEDHNKTTNTNYSFTGLLSGTSYNISVATVGAMEFKSATVQITVTTRPFGVNGLTTSTGEENITATWNNPVEYKPSYCYELSWHSSGDPIFKNATKENNFKRNKLVPGKQYNISVTTKTSDGTKGDPTWISNCTNASPVKNLACLGPNTTIAQVILSWEKNNGVNSGFLVTVNNGEIVNSTPSCCNYTVSNLRHKTSYDLAVVTQSCGLPSSPVSQTCWTGITNPPIPNNYDSLVSVSMISYDRFSLQISKSLLNNTNGPIQNIGVLVTDQLPDAKNFTEYVSRTYQEWNNGATPVYMATVVTLTENSFSSRSEEEHLDIEIGSKTTWNGYTNGALKPKGKYQYAIVLFTSLSLANNLVNGHLFTITQFYEAVELQQDPAFIGIIVGATLGIFCVLFIILIGFIIYWKRLSNKDSPDIQIHTMRAKVSIAVRMEDFEAYYKKQRADSSCGFAEEFEDLKLVGTAQSRIQALTLDNKPKNRYNNVLPYDSSRVKLSIIHGSPYEDYINANYMPGYNSRKEYIAAQGPLPSTVSEFWRMIWEKNVQTLVMLTRCNEQGRVKCEQYWDHGTKHFDNITVTTSSEIKLDDWTIRDFDVKNVKTAETRSVRHFHFTAWPDHGVPETTELLISFRHLVREHMDQYSRNSPTVVHCSAGVGRTGTFITIDRLIFQIERESFVDVYGIVHDLRMHRTLMVQTEDQYVFLNQCALDIIRSRTGNNVDLIYQNTAAMSIYENIDPKTGYLRA